MTIYFTMNLSIYYSEVHTMDIQQLEKLFESLKTDQHISPDEIPDLDLYMDQVITFFENHLSHTKRKPEDKLLTKTMINNYAKNKLLMPAVKKKYTHDHLLVLALIYELKQVTSLEDIQSLLNLLKTSDSEDHEILHQVYDHYLDMQKIQKQCVKETLCSLHEKKKPPHPLKRIRRIAPYFVFCFSNRV